MSHCTGKGERKSEVKWLFVGRLGINFQQCGSEETAAVSKTSTFSELTIETLRSTIRHKMLHCISTERQELSNFGSAKGTKFNQDLGVPDWNLLTRRQTAATA